MNYYYDLKLNFQKNNCLFYEWEELDKYELVNKIPVIYISTNDMEQILANHIKVTAIINDLVLLVDKNSTIVIKFDNNGYEIARSFLLLNDELGIIDSMRNKKSTDFKYEIINKVEYNPTLRYEERIKTEIDKEIKKIINEKNYAKLEYLYLEWFNKKNNRKQMIIDIENKLKEQITNDEIKIYDLIILSKKKV